jgi:hypothetical protein
MMLMTRFRRRLKVDRATWLLLLALLPLALMFESGCSRPVGLHNDDSTAQAGQRDVPFQDGTGSTSAKPTLTPVQEHSTTPETALPFRDDQSLPAGTLLTVRLKNPISAENPGASGTFEAVVDEPLTIDGNTLVPRGAIVAGRVESARALKAKSNRGYVRLILNSIDVSGRDLPLQTSSLFTRGKLDEPASGLGDASASVIHLEKGRRLTFRLTEPVYVASQRPILSH